MNFSQFKDPLFEKAVAAIDSGNTAVLKEILHLHPQLINEQAYFPGGGYFEKPYLVYFVADNPIRHETLPQNILDIMQVLLENVNRYSVNRQHQLDYTLGLVASGRIPKESGRQIAMMDLLIDAGAAAGDGAAALTHGNIEAAKHLISCGGKYTLVAAVCFDEKDKVQELLPESSKTVQLTALTAATFYGNAEMTALLLKAGVDPNGYPANGFHTHATPLHQGVYSGKIEIVKLLIDAGADVAAKDKIYSGTALEWARHMQTGEMNENARNSFKEIENYLSS